MSCPADDIAASPLDPAPATRTLARAIERELDRLASKPVPPGLYLVATPIGNLADVTIRALHVLSSADVVYCEDTRTSSRLLQHFGIQTRMRPFHEHNEDTERDRIVRQIEDGRRVALISDAGTPLVSDPGFKLVRECAGKGLLVTSLPGPSAVLAALAAGGLPTDQFTFAGFLPPKQAGRRARLTDLRALPGTLVLFEAPQRLAEALEDMATVLGARPAVVARELTKLHEELARGSLPDLAAAFASREIKGEIAVLIGQGEAPAVSDADIESRLATALETMRLKDAVAAVADALGVAKTRVYALGLKIKGERE